MLDDIAMVAADTTRSKAYLRAMISSQMIPNHVIVLKSKKHRAGQKVKTKSKVGNISYDNELTVDANELFDAEIEVSEILNKLSISYEVIENDDINDAEVVSILKARPEKTLIYSGFGGVILKKETLKIGKNFLHVHGGYLPDYKGSTTNYYSLLCDNELGASSIFLSEEIDSGDLLLRKKYQAPADCENIDHVYDSEVRSNLLVETLKNYCDTNRWDVTLPKTTSGETYYIIHPVLKHIAILANRN